MRVAIFSYWSLLDPVSARQEGCVLDTIACIVPGWSLAWCDVRSADDDGLKRFVDLRTFEPVPSFAFAQVVPNACGSVAGAAVVIDERDLGAFDHRERGMTRVRIDPAQCRMMDGRALSSAFGGDLFVYTAPRPSSRLAPVCAGYVNMGLRGACALDQRFAGFWDAFSRSLPWPQAQFFEADFIELERDARTFTLLNFDGLDKTPIFRAPTPLMPQPLDFEPPAVSEASLYAAADLRAKPSETARSLLPWPLREATLLRDDLAAPLGAGHWLKSLALACRGQAAKGDAWVERIVNTRDLPSA